jgi:N-acetyl-1-D-myo-inositol-2-amino-2-deoxy-alpha-D-glucopyranoside deacetylase
MTESAPPDLPERRILFVHAHPDDETINNGATMARYVSEGAHVTLVTCTRGEQGEVIPEELRHLSADQEDRLGEHRGGELAAAMAALGVTDHRFLDAGATRPDGSRVHYRDSGMTLDGDRRIVLPTDARADAFARADVDEAAGHLAAVIAQVRPQVVVTYEPGGGYGHPDHVQAHRVTMRAVELAAQRPAGDGSPGWQVPKLYWVVVPEALMKRAIEAMAGSPDNPFEAWSQGPMPSMVVPDDLVTSVVDGTGFLGRKTDALRAHATQIAVDGPFFALSNGIGAPLASMEFYRLVHGTPSGQRDEDGRETDLFAGTSA